jgi:hypothetical protein
VETKLGVTPPPKNEEPPVPSWLSLLTNQEQPPIPAPTPSSFAVTADVEEEGAFFGPDWLKSIGTANLESEPVNEQPPVPTQLSPLAEMWARIKPDLVEKVTPPVSDVEQKKDHPIRYRIL